MILVTISNTVTEDKILQKAYHDYGWWWWFGCQEDRGSDEAALSGAGPVAPRGGQGEPSAGRHCGPALSAGRPGTTA